MKKTILILALIAILALPVVALADGILTILPGTLDVTDQLIDFGSIPFSWSLQQPITNGTWNISDGVGDGLGWRVEILGTDFDDGAGNLIPVSAALQSFRATVPNSGIACLVGCGAAVQPITQAPAPVYAFLDPVVPDVLISNGLGSELGSWDFLTTWQLDVPGGTPGGSVYSSVVTVTANVGP
jgi:hypothetical protein